VGAIVPTVGRMRRGMTVQRLRSELVAAARGWSERSPKYYAHRMPQQVEARPFIIAWAGDLRAILTMLVGAAALVLLISCANVASLQLVRTTGRAHELALRAALGASRAAIARQQIIESLLLAVTGGILGVLLGQGLVVTAGRVAAERIPELRGLHLDPLVLASSAIATGVAAILSGTVPGVASGERQRGRCACGERGPQQLGGARAVPVSARRRGGASGDRACATRVLRDRSRESRPVDPSESGVPVEWRRSATAERSTRAFTAWRW
jgi:hypothetical protein